MMPGTAHVVPPSAEYEKRIRESSQRPYVSLTAAGTPSPHASQTSKIRLPIWFTFGAVPTSHVASFSDAVAFASGIVSRVTTLVGAHVNVVAPVGVQSFSRISTVRPSSPAESPAA